jgi:hypothetical protein
MVSGAFPVFDTCPNSASGSPRRMSIMTPLDDPEPIPKEAS